MQDTDAILNKGTAMLIDEATLIDFGPRGGRKNLQGEDLTPPEMSMTFSTEMDRLEGKLNTLGHLYKQTGAVRLWLEFVEQLDHGLARKDAKPLEEVDPRPRLTDPLGTMPAARNGTSAEGSSAHDAEPIKQSKREKVKTGGDE